MRDVLRQVDTTTVVIVFDGVCVLCGGWVRFLLRRDRKKRYRFATMQGAHGRVLLRAYGLDPEDPLSFLLVEDGKAWTDSDAVLRVLVGLGGFWRVAAWLRVFPRCWRDACYRWLARNRYRWFGRHAQCLLPEPAERERFLD
ncbi:MAG TPA: thiol-disulfide oxidoreductase DCC family protein [Xylella taiwanensis]